MCLWCLTLYLYFMSVKSLLGLNKVTIFCFKKRRNLSSRVQVGQGKQKYLLKCRSLVGFVRWFKSLQAIQRLFSSSRSYTCKEKKKKLWMTVSLWLTKSNVIWSHQYTTVGRKNNNKLLCVFYVCLIQIFSSSRILSNHNNFILYISIISQFIHKLLFRGILSKIFKFLKNPKHFYSFIDGYSFRIPPWLYLNFKTLLTFINSYSDHSASLQVIDSLMVKETA